MTNLGIRLFCVLTWVLGPIPSFGEHFVKEELKSVIKNIYKHKLQPTDNMLDRAFQITNRDITSVTSYDDIFKGGWNFKAAYMGKPVQEGQAIRIPVVFNQTHIHHRGFNLKFRRSSRAFSVLVTPSPSGQKIELFECVDSNWPTSMKIQIRRSDIHEDTLKKSLPGFFSMASMFLSGDLKQHMANPGSFIENMMKVSLNEEEKQLALEYGHWYGPIYNSWVDEDGSQFQDPCVKTRNYAPITPDMIAKPVDRTAESELGTEQGSEASAAE